MSGCRIKLKRIARFRYGDALVRDTSEGEIPVFGSNGAYQTTNRANTDAPVILVGRKGSYGKINWSDQAVFASDTTFYIDRAAAPKCELRWLYYALGTLRLDEGNREAAVPGLSRETAHESLVKAPPLPTQRRIAAYLDRETAQIDALVAENETLLALLEEKRASLISHAVTRGLNPKAKLKPSGIPWLGDVPVHWSVLPLKRLTTTIKTGTTPNTDDVTVEGDFDWYTPGDFGHDIHLSPSKRRIFRESESFDSLRVFPVGTILFVGIGATLGKCSVSLTDCSANQQINAIVPTRETNSIFLCLSLRAQAEGIRLMANASTIGILNQERTSAIPIAVPPPAEQSAIAAECLRISTATDRAIAEIQTSITLLREKRSSLISAAVTGEMAV
jgi:type I restriction enzyme S subunit